MNRILELVLPNILGSLCATVAPVVLKWWRERRIRARASRDALARVAALETAWERTSERVEAALAEVRMGSGAWKLAGALQRRVESTELRLDTLHQEVRTSLDAAHETARSAVNAVKGAKGGRRAAATAPIGDGEVTDWAQFGQGVDQLMKSPQGRAQLIREIQQMENGAGAPVAGDFSPPPT